jgi:uroporphyrinogen decarboxylase
VLKLFDSWSDGLPEDQFERLVTRPHAEIVKRLRAAGVKQPVIGFPRGAGALVEGYAARAGVDCIALDVQAPAELGRRLQARGAIQGALDPLLLRAGGDALDQSVRRQLAQWGSGPYVFNLGHGILPDTPIEHVARVVELVAGAGPA